MLKLYTFLSKICLFITEKPYGYQESWQNVTKIFTSIKVLQWNIDFQYQYQYIEDIDAGIDIELRFLNFLHMHDVYLSEQTQNT